LEKGESDDAKSVDNEQQNCIVPSSSEKTLDRFEEIRTIASSDIEVIRQIDDWYEFQSIFCVNNFLFKKKYFLV